MAPTPCFHEADGIAAWQKARIPPASARPLAEQLRADGVKVWFDDWVLKPGDSIEKNQSKTAKIEEGLGFDLPIWHFKFSSA